MNSPPTTGTTVYRTPSQSAISGIIAAALALFAVAQLASAPNVVFGAFVVVLFVPAVGLLVRAAASRIVVDAAGVSIHNPLGRVDVPWHDITAFDLGRAGLFGCVLRVHRETGPFAHAFGIQGITGQPGRASSRRAQAIADDLTSRASAYRASV